MAPPGLELEWDQGLFRAARALFRHVRGGAHSTETDDSARMVRLADQAAALSAFARALSGLPLRVLPGSGAGGVRGRDLLLPETLALAPSADENRALYVLRTALSAAICRLRLHEIVPQGDALPEPLPALRAAETACAWLAAELPGFAERMREARSWALAARPDPARLRGVERERELARVRWLRGEAPWNDSSLCRSLRRADSARSSARSPALAWVGELLAPPEMASLAGGASAREDALAAPQPTSEAEATRVGAIERVALERDARGDIVWNPFERVETLDTYQGGSRNLDGGDDLQGHLEALEEVDLGKIVRGGPPAEALLRADVELDTDAPEVGQVQPGEHGVPYDEWDHRTRSHRKDWCTVYPTALTRLDPAWARDASVRQRRRVEELLRRLERHRAGLRSVDRQLDGEDVDLAALIDEHSAVAAGHGGNPRLYVRQEQRRRDFATTVLLDVSLSTDAWIRGRRVLDVARDAVFVLGEVAAQLGDRLRVLAFASETRNHCRVFEVLGWGEPWSLGRARLGALRPQGYTRIGAAVRHASSDLAAVSAERKLLLLVSDGKPTDYDRYEGRYGIADVRQALREAGQRGLRTHALAVDAVAREWLPELFGPGAWHVLPRPELLPDVLTEVYGRLTAR